MCGLVTEKHRGQAELLVRRMIRPGEVTRLEPDEALHVLSTLDIDDPQTPRPGDVVRAASGFRTGDVEGPGLATCLERG